MKIPVKLTDYEVLFINNRGLIVDVLKYPKHESFNNSIIRYGYVPLFGVFLFDHEEDKQYKVTEGDIPEYFIKDIGDLATFDPSLK